MAMVIAVGLAIALISFGFGYSYGWRERKRQDVVDAGLEWLKSEVELVVPIADFGHLWNLDYNGTMKISLKRADNVIVQAKHCQHVDSPLTSIITAQRT